MNSGECCGSAGPADRQAVPRAAALCTWRCVPGLLPSAPNRDVGFRVVLCSPGAAVAETLQRKTLGGHSAQGMATAAVLALPSGSQLCSFHRTWTPRHAGARERGGGGGSAPRLGKRGSGCSLPAAAQPWASLAAWLLKKHRTNDKHQRFSSDELRRVAAQCLMRRGLLVAALPPPLPLPWQGCRWWTPVLCFRLPGSCSGAALAVPALRPRCVSA